MFSSMGLTGRSARGKGVILDSRIWRTLLTLFEDSIAENDIHAW